MSIYTAAVVSSAPSLPNKERGRNTACATRSTSLSGWFLFVLCRRKSTVRLSERTGTCLEHIPSGTEFRLQRPIRLMKRMQSSAKTYPDYKIIRCCHGEWVHVGSSSRFTPFSNEPHEAHLVLHHVNSFHLTYVPDRTVVRSVRLRTQQREKQRTTAVWSITVLVPDWSSKPRSSRPSQRK